MEPTAVGEARRRFSMFFTLNNFFNEANTEQSVVSKRHNAAVMDIQRMIYIFPSSAILRKFNRDAIIRSEAQEWDWITNVQTHLLIQR